MDGRTPGRGRCPRLILLLAACSVALPASVWVDRGSPAALALGSFVVTTTTDGFDDDLTDGVCDDGTGECTLRAAVDQGNYDGGSTTVALPTGTLDVHLAYDSGLGYQIGSIVIASDITIVGAGRSLTTVEYDASLRDHGIFKVVGGASLDISALTMTSIHELGRSGANGIVVTEDDASLVVTDVLFDDLGGVAVAGWNIGLEPDPTGLDIRVHDSQFEGYQSSWNYSILVDDVANSYVELTNSVVDDMGYGLLVSGNDLPGNLLHVVDTTFTDSSDDPPGAFEIYAGFHAVLERVDVSDHQWGVYHSRGGTLTVRDSTFANNEWYGLSVYADQLDVEDTTFVGNGDYAVDMDGGPLRISGSTITGHVNGIWSNFSDITPDTITNTTISGSDYEALELTPGSVLRNVTITGNGFADGGGYPAVYAYDELLLENTVIAGNSVDCEGTGAAGTNSADGDGTCGLTGPGNLAGIDPIFEPLADNGGPTLTHALQPGSPLIDAGDNAVCAAVDQRGGARPVDGDGNGSPICDIGAFEAGAEVIAQTTIDWSAPPARRGMLRPDSDLEITVDSPDAGASALAHVEVSSWYPDGDTGQPILGAPAPATIPVALTESAAGHYTGSLALDGIAAITQIAAHVDNGGAGVDVDTTTNLPITVAGGLAFQTAMTVATWMLPNPRVELDSAATSDGDSIVVPLVGSTPTRWLRPGDDYRARLTDAEHRTIADDTTDIEVRAGLITSVDLPTDVAAYVPFSARIVGLNDLPVAGVKVSIQDVATGDEVAQDVTSADGIISGVIRGETAHVTVDPLEEPYLGTDTDVTITALGETIDVSLGAGLPTAVVSGVVSHPLRPTVPNVRISFTTEIGDRDFTTSALTDEDGSYSAEVFQGPVTVRVDDEYVGRVETSQAINTDTTIDLLLEGPLLIDVDIDLQTRFAGDGAPTPVDINWRVTAHYRLRMHSGRTNLPVATNTVRVPLQTGNEIEFCADGYEAGLPAACQDAVVDLATQTATVSLLLEQQGLVQGIMRWNVPLLGGYRPDPTVSLARIEADGHRTAVWLSEPEPPTTFVENSFTQVGFSIPTPGPGDYELVLDVEHYEGSPAGPGTRFHHVDQLRVAITVPLNGVVDVGALEVPHDAFAAFDTLGALSLSPGDIVPGEHVQVRMATRNSTPDPVTDAVLRLELPTGTTVPLDSVLVDGVPAAASIVDGALEVPVGTVDPDESIALTAWLDVASDFGAGGLLVSGNVAHGGRVEHIGSAIAVVRQLTINAARTTTTFDIPVWGRAVPGTEVEVLVDGSRAALVQASTGGVWRTAVTLPEVPLARTFELAAVADGVGGTPIPSPSVKVTYDPTLPILERAVFRQEEGRSVEIDPSSGVAEFPYVWVPAQQTYVDLDFDHPELIENPEVWIGQRRADFMYFDETSGLWVARAYPRESEVGDVRANWTATRAPIDLSPDPAQEVLTTAEARAMLPPGLASFENLNVVESGPNGTTVDVDFPDLGVRVETGSMTSSVDYTPTVEDLDFADDLGAPIYGFATEQVPGPGGVDSLRMTMTIPDAALGSVAAPVAARLSPTGPVALTAPSAAAGGLSTLLDVTVALKPDALFPTGRLEVLFGLVTGVGGDGLGATFADEYLVELDTLGQLADDRCAVGQIASYREQLDTLSYMYMASIVLSAGLMVLGLVAGPETLGLGTLAAWGVTEIVNRVVAKQLERETKRLKREIDTSCPPDPEPTPPPPPPPPCAPEWNLVPPALGGPDCHQLADPTYIFDPSGFVYSVLESNRLEGVTTTLESASDPGGPWTVWDAEWFGQDNPLVTDAAGAYGWDVPAGWWRVRYEAPGYETDYSEALEVLPPHFDVNVGLRSLTDPVVSGTSAVGGTSFVDVTFDDWMGVDTMPAERVAVSDGSGPVGVSVSYPDQETSDVGPVAKGLRIDVGRPLVAGESLGIELDRMIATAGDVPFGEEVTVPVVVSAAPPDAQTINFPALPNRTYGVAPFAATATATSGLTVAMSAVGPCSLTGSTVTVTGAGSCTITANQSGDANWEPAPTVQRTFAIARKAVTVQATDRSATAGDPVPALSATATGLVSPDTLASLGGAKCSTGAPVVAGVLTTPGSYAISCTGPSSANYMFGHVAGTLLVKAPPPDEPPPDEPPPTPDAVPLVPARLLETRSDERTTDGEYAGIGRATAGSITKVHLAGRGGIPNDATAAIVNLTVVAPDDYGFATIYPCTPTPPTASNINYTPGAFVANSVTAKLDPDGNICIYTLAATDLLIDANGYIPAGSSIGTLLPARLLETRSDERTTDGKYAGIGRATAGSITKVHLAGRGGIPNDATAAIVNLTVVAPDDYGFATIYPCTPTPPTASNINYTPGAFVANSVFAKLDEQGDICIYTLAATDLLIDANASMSN